MPKMDGLEFLKNAGKMISTTPAIITSIRSDVAVKTVRVVPMITQTLSSLNCSFRR